MLWRELLTSLKLGVLNKIVFGTNYPGVRQSPYVDTPMPVTSYTTHICLRIPEDQPSGILDKNAWPLLPET